MKARILLSFAALMMVIPSAATAGPQTKTYIAGPGGTIVGPRSEAPSVSGAVFANPGFDPAFVTVSDTGATAAGAKVLFKVCQPACSAEGATLKAYCVNSGSKQTLPASFSSSSLPVYVFIYTEETVASLWVGSIACPEAIGTTGTVTLS